MYKSKIFIFAVVSVLFVFSFAVAATKPLPDADLGSLSYVFYLYFDSGQLVGDRDYEVKYDVISEKFVAESPVPGSYKLEISNSKSELAQTVQFDPRQGDSSFNRGKVQVKAPYVPNGTRVSFFDNQNRQLMTIFVTAVALCNDDGFCNSAEGENDKTCSSDCRTARTTPLATSLPLDTSGEGLDYIMLGIYGVGGLVVVMGAWFGWRWWKKKREENFMPPPSAPSAGGVPFPPLPQ